MIAFDNWFLLATIKIIFNMKIITRSKEMASFQIVHSTLRSRYPTCLPSHYSIGKRAESNLLVIHFQVKFWSCEGHSACISHHKQLVISHRVSEPFWDIKIYEFHLRISIDIVCNHHIVRVYVSIRKKMKGQASYLPVADRYFFWVQVFDNV